MKKIEIQNLGVPSLVKFSLRPRILRKKSPKTYNFLRSKAENQRFSSFEESNYFAQTLRFSNSLRHCFHFYYFQALFEF